MRRLEGRTAVVTGGGTGIGFASARRFVEEGAFVFLFGRRRDRLDAAVAELGGQARAVAGSVADPADLDRLFDAVKAEGRGLDILFANAGTGEVAPLAEITAEQIDGTFDVNVKGLLFTVQKALPLMKAGGSIILTGSTAGVMGLPAFSVYSASKAAVRSFARGWAQDLKGTGIRVNVLSPGPTRTKLAVDVVGEEAMAAMGADAPLGRVGDPAETAAAVAFLASDDSSFMTGSEVFVDGGTAQI
jgi:NAD(P)-dependent dehydrogenase (short-subunit alcohol dehydrogenase family)